jgi:multicomponent Na+:H+ antiporter subunit A
VVAPPDTRSGRARELAPHLATALAVVAFLVILAGAGRGWSVDAGWAPTLDLRLSFALDGLGVLYGLLATGIGALVFVYASRSVDRHLEHEGRPARDSLRLHGFLFLFMVSMVGLVTAQDLILLFVFWDLTAVASYFLIGFDRHRREARAAALMALLVTGVSAVLLLIAALVLYGEYGTFQLPQLFERAEAATPVALAGFLIAIAGLAKSAQVPFHFWLARAMAAPTPVSAYLHSAAMVAAGVFLLGRTYPLLELSRGLLDVLLWVGVLSMAVGGVLALTRDELKQVLASSTVAQYGYVVFMLGLGGPDVALVAVLVETMFALLFLGIFALLPRDVLRREARVVGPRSRRWRDPLVAGVAGLLAFAVVWATLSRPTPEQSVAAQHVRLTPDAHAKDVVTAILADFRGLDTLGEITVICVALIGMAALLRRGRLW